MVQAPMISCPLKQTNEVDWVHPLKQYIRTTYGDDPERYSEECSTLNRLRQDMRGAGADSASGRDLLYRYYGQLELLDLRFPVDENHIKVSPSSAYIIDRTPFLTVLCRSPSPGTMLLQPSQRASTVLLSRRPRLSSISAPYCHV